MQSAMPSALAQDLSSAEAFQALGSDVRMNILRNLIRGDCSVAQLARAARLHPATIRYHLSILLQDGLVEKVPTRRDGRVGRPTTRYCIRNVEIGGFPPRRYEILSEILLLTMGRLLDRQRSDQALYEAGRESGQRMVAGVEEAAKVSEWGPREFVQHCLLGAFASMGMQTEVVQERDDFVRFRAFTCPFQELAVKYPDRVCDSLDRGFHEGIATRMGSLVVGERLACMGHGDAFCEYSLHWAKLKEAEQHE